MITYTSSIELVLDVVSDRFGKITEKGKVKLVARNDELVFKCTKCKKDVAIKFCAVCNHERDRNRASFCDNCVDLHKCEEEIAIPIVNSPSSGEWGYES